jgi:hypothetical protein
MNRLLLLALAIPLAVAPAPARAQNAAEQAEARTLFDEGARLFEQGKFAEACTKLEASYHLFAGVGTRGKLAQCYEKVGRTASAWAMYQEVVALAGKAGDERRVRVAEERVAALSPHLAHLTIVVPAASDVAGLEVKRGDQVVERGVMGSAVAVDPGAIAFTVSAPGHVTKTVEVNVVPEKDVTFTVPALEESAPPPAPPPAPSASASPPAPSEPAQAAPRAPAAWQVPAGIAVGGAGVVTATVGIVLAIAAKSSYDGAFDSGDCSRATLTCATSSGQSQTDGARSQANVGGVLIGAGAVLAAGGAVLFLLGARSGSPPATTAIQVTPSLGPAAAGLVMTGGF